MDALINVKKCLGELSKCQKEIDELSSEGLELESEHRALADNVDLQTSDAISTIAKNHETLRQQLQLAIDSQKRTIEAVSPSREQRLLSWHPLGSRLTSKDTIPSACRDLVVQFDRLAELAADANKKLNEIYRDFLETEDKLDLHAKNVEEYEGKCEEFGDIEEVRDEVREALKYLAESCEEAEENMKESSITYSIWQEDQRHEQKKARWLWTAAPLTGGLSIPFALYASHEKRVSRRLRDFHATTISIEKVRISQLEIYAAELMPYVSKIQDATKKLENMRISAARLTRKTKSLSHLVGEQGKRYISLKGMAMHAASSTRALQSRVSMLAYAEGGGEVRRVLGGLADDLSQMGVKFLTDSGDSNDWTKLGNFDA